MLNSFRISFASQFLTMVEIAKAIQNGKKVSELTDIKQTFFLQDKKQPLPVFEGETIELMSHEVCLKDKKKSPPTSATSKKNRTRNMQRG